MSSRLVAGLLVSALAATVSAAPALAPADPAAVAAKPKRPPKILPGEAIELKTRDGWTIAARYSPAKQDQYTFVLLHGGGGRKEDWYYLAKAMTRRGLGVMALDLRGHGASTGAPPGQPAHYRKFIVNKQQNEWVNMAADVEAAVAYLTAAGVLNTSIAMGGADIGSSIALRYAAVKPAVPLLFLLSAGMSYRDVPTVNAIRAYTKRPILFVVGNDDNKSTRETAVLMTFAKRAAGEENTTLITADREHGTKMLQVNRGLITQILDWIEYPVQEPEAPTISTDSVEGTGSDALPTDEELENQGAAGGPDVAPPSQ